MSDDSLNNFTPRAQQVMALARLEANRLNHGFIGTEHLLLGLIKLGHGVAVNVLQRMGLDLETVRIEVEKRVGTGTDPAMVNKVPYVFREKKGRVRSAKMAVDVLQLLGLDLETVRLEIEKRMDAGLGPKVTENTPYTPPVKKALSLAAKEAKALNHTYVGTEHILLGLLREGNGAGAQVLKVLDIDLERARKEILKELDPNYNPPEQQLPQEPSEEDGRKGEVKTPAFKAFGRDLTAVAPQGGRDEILFKFTPRAQQVMALARLEANRLNHGFIGTEHLLLGLIKLGHGVAVNVLQRMGLDLETVRLEVEKRVGTGPDQKIMGNIPYTPRVKKVLALSAKEAKALNHAYIGTGHFLLGLLREGDGTGAQVLNALDIQLEPARKAVAGLSACGQSPPPFP